jgi:predicted Zn-dependent peptidase
MVLSLESTAARMNRLGSALLNGLPLLTLDEAVERIEAVTLDDMAELTAELLAPERLSAAGVGVEEDVFRGALEPLGIAAARAAA